MYWCWNQIIHIYQFDWWFRATNFTYIFRLLLFPLILIFFFVRFLRRLLLTVHCSLNIFKNIFSIYIVYKCFFFYRSFARMLNVDVHTCSHSRTHTHLNECIQIYDCDAKFMIWVEIIWCIYLCTIYYFFWILFSAFLSCNSEINTHNWIFWVVCFNLRKLFSDDFVYCFVLLWPSNSRIIKMLFAHNSMKPEWMNEKKKKICFFLLVAFIYILFLIWTILECHTNFTFDRPIKLSNHFSTFELKISIEIQEK